MTNIIYINITKSNYKQTNIKPRNDLRLRFRIPGEVRTELDNGHGSAQLVFVEPLAQAEHRPPAVRHLRDAGLSGLTECQEDVAVDAGVLGRRGPSVS